MIAAGVFVLVLLLLGAGYVAFIAANAFGHASQTFGADPEWWREDPLGRP